MKQYTYLSKPIIRTGDLQPKGIKSTYGVNIGFNETFKHIYDELSVYRKS